jgi:hypothetical protein
MPWYKVVIVNNESASWSIVGLMKQFILRYKLVGSPTDAVVYRGMNDLGDHIYYFSSPASGIALAHKVFQTFDAIQCAEKPDLYGFKAITIW